MSRIRNVVVGVSGGVDSAVAALLLKKKGFNVTGLFMTNWDEKDEKGACMLSQDREDARSVCQMLDIPFREVNFVKRYWCDVFLYLIYEYQNGLTPNPDILCNRHIKFDSFFNYSMSALNADAIATGHYALTNQGPFMEYPKVEGDVRLLTPVDTFKDQTFFLSQVSQRSLQRTMFPIGMYTKETVKKIALTNGLHKIGKKRESTGICFIGDRKFRDFIQEYIPSNPGLMIDITTGKILKKHEGLHLWTIGQRARIEGFAKQYFIAAKDSKENVIYVAPGTDHSSLFSSMLYTEIPHWISDSVERIFDEFGVVKCFFRFQHTKPKVSCVIYKMVTNQLLVRLERPLKSITSGQFAVFYKDNECLGSAKIIQRGPSLFALNLEIPTNYKEYEHFRVTEDLYRNVGVS